MNRDGSAVAGISSPSVSPGPDGSEKFIFPCRGEPILRRGRVEGDRGPTDLEVARAPLALEVVHHAQLLSFRYEVPKPIGRNLETCSRPRLLRGNLVTPGLSVCTFYIPSTRAPSAADIDKVQNCRDMSGVDVKPSPLNSIAAKFDD